MNRDHDDDIEREIRTHLELEAEDQQAAGMNAKDAQFAARRAFGNPTLIAEETRSVWRWVSLDVFLQDLRYAIRTMRRAPGLAMVAIASSALGIGACTVIFSVLEFALFKPLPVEHPGRLMRLSELDRRTGESGNELSYLDFVDVRNARAFDGIAAYDPLLAVSIRAHGDPERHWGALATANYFAVVKPPFVVGRGFDPQRDDERGAPRVVVLSHDLWQRSFGADPTVVGRTVAINSSPATVIGVTAAGFRGTDVGIVPEFWIPFSMIDEVEGRLGPVTTNRRRFWLASVARLRPNVDLRVARAELDVIARTLNNVYGRKDDRGFALERAGQIDPRLRTMAVTVFAVALAAALLVLLAACSNVANLLLGRASSRRREIAARMALGASRARLVRQLLTESLFLSLLGGLGGWIVAGYTSSLLSLLGNPLGWPVTLSVAPDVRVLLFCLGLSILTGVAFGLLPALRGTKADLVANLKADRGGLSRSERFGLRNGLVVAQVMICTILLLCMGLFLRSFQQARATDLGLRADNVILLTFDPSLDRRSDVQSRQLLGEILDRARAVPGIESATLTSAVPLTLIISNSNFIAAENAGNSQAPRVRTDIYAVGPKFFETMGMPFLAGEDFRSDEAASRRSAIVNEAFARAAFAEQTPLGRRVLGDGKALDIIGLVATAKSRSIGEAPRPAIYVPILNEYAARDTLRGVTLVAKTGMSDASIAPLREAIHSVDRSLAVFDVRSMDRHVRDALILPRVTWAVSAVAGVIGLMIATIGVYGVISFAVVTRRRELGIRLAVGARPRAIVAYILRHGAVLAAIGTGLGALVAFGVTRFVASLLYGVSPADPLTFVVAPVFVIIVALIACALPARAAAQVDPVEVLRSE
jgi:putative ABC transport system permease protein